MWQSDLSSIRSDDAPRKKRKICPNSDDDQVDECQAPLLTSGVSSVQAPSRVKRNIAKKFLEQESVGTSVPVNPNTTFASLGLRPYLVQALANVAIKRPTSIQENCIPEILMGRDCIGISRTGSGKTLAFAAPILQRLAEDPSAIFAVVLTATRELAQQIHDHFHAISAAQTLRIALITGGESRLQQSIALARSPHVVIATPGRLADHIRNGAEDVHAGFRRLKFLVYDEVDRLLGFGKEGSMEDDIQDCLEVFPPPEKLQTMWFTATKHSDLDLRQAKWPPKPHAGPIFVCEIDPEKPSTPSTLSQTYLKAPLAHKDNYLHKFLLTPANESKLTIIFCNSTRAVEILHSFLESLDHRVTSLHSQLQQWQRTAHLGKFRALATRILVATDVAARGLDIPEVSLVVNYDVPRDPGNYIHRVGRTARAGRKGEAVTFVCEANDVAPFLAIEQHVGAGKMAEWAEEGVNLETRVLRDGLKVEGEVKTKARLDVERRRKNNEKKRNRKAKITS